MFVILLALQKWRLALYSVVKVNYDYVEYIRLLICRKGSFRMPANSRTL